MDYEEFAGDILEMTGVDLHAYKRHQMERRIRSYMIRFNYTELGDYMEHLKADSAALGKFLDRITINVSELFRNADKFEQLTDQFLKPLIAERGALKIWSAGCSYGAEPYSVAVILRDISPELKHDILATDIDTRILVRAQEGIFDDHDIKNVTKRRLIDHFHTVGQHRWKVNDEVKSMVRFDRTDLIKDEPEKGFDVILCRNVVIYFTDEAKDIVYKHFFKALKPGGILFVGSTERIFTYQDIGYELLCPFFYRKPDKAARESS